MASPFGSYKGEEDCLHLNVYTKPVTDDRDLSTARRAVLVWIHGGGFITGSGGPDVYGPDYMLERDIVSLRAYCVKKRS